MLKKISFLDKTQILSKNFVRPKKMKIIFEDDFFVIVYKPSGIPAAPLRKDETLPLLSQFLDQYPHAKAVKGKKEIEAGLIHRLDTATSGLVLIAKTQAAYNFFIKLQNTNQLEKKYIAIVEKKELNLKKSILQQQLPKFITSQFRPFGPKQKKVAPVFSNDKRFKTDEKNYTTKIIDIEKIDDTSLVVTCSLTKGYRHQIRSHLASIGLPIQNDALYNTNYAVKNPKELETHTYDLQLYAVEISFPYTLTKSKN